MNTEITHFFAILQARIMSDAPSWFWLNKQPY